MNKLKVSEIFLSIQGEGTEQGEPTIFIRLFGCNYRCKWCDTKYAMEGNDYREMTLDEIIEEISLYDYCENVQITGGEPLIQDIDGLVERLTLKDKIIWINTNGSIDFKHFIKGFYGKDCRIMMDIKTPSSGMAERTNWNNLKYLRTIDQVLFVIATEEDYIFAKNISKIIEAFSSVKVLFSPAFSISGFKPVLTPAVISSKIIEDKLKVRLSIQIHKIIWDKNKRKV